MEGIFISYRREETAGHAGRVYDRLREHFGRDRVFMDVSAIEPGVDFIEAIDHAVSSCAVLLVIIGRNWLDCSDATGQRRLDGTTDFIRLEVGTALRRNIRVIPVLVQAAGMPGEADLPDDLKLLARRNAIEINDTHWDTDLSQLVDTLDRVLGGAGGTVSSGATDVKPLSNAPKNRLVWVVSSITAVLIALTGLLSSVESFRNSFVRLFKGSPQVITTGATPVGNNTPPAGQEPGIPLKESVPPVATQQNPHPPKLITVPDLTGQLLDRALALLEKNGLLAGEVEKRETGEIAPNTIIAQSPKPGTMLTNGKKVNLVVTVRPPEPELVTVPNVVRQPLELAVKMLREAGLRPGTETRRPTDKARAGTILAQKIKGGATARHGTAVDLLVAVQPAVDGTADEPPVALKVLARGGLEVHQTDLFDLDSGQIVRNRDADFWFEAVTETERYLTPRNGASIGFTREKTTYEICSQVKMTEQRIPIRRIPKNSYACVRTSRGNLASFKLLEPVGPSPGIMKISYITWERAR